MSTVQKRVPRAVHARTRKPGTTSNGSIERLAILAGFQKKGKKKVVTGVHRMSKAAFEVAREHVQLLIEKYSHDLKIIARYMKVKRVNVSVLQYVAKAHGHNLYDSGDKSFSKCHSVQAVMASKNKDATGGCLVMLSKPFKDAVRTAVNGSSTKKGEFSFTKSFMEHFQYLIEDKMIGMFRAAISVASEIGGRSTLMSKDLIWCKDNAFSHDGDMATKLADKDAKKKARKIKKKVVTKKATKTLKSDVKKHKPKSDAKKHKPKSTTKIPKNKAA